MIPIVTPIILPQKTEPSICPSCQRIEKKKVICAHCGHEYKAEDEPMPLGFKIFFLFMLFVILWALITAISLPWDAGFSDAIELWANWLGLS